jgi:hypothetical protein
MSDTKVGADARTRQEAGEVDRYGNGPDEQRYCSFPDCGCDGARLCQAEEGPHRGAMGLNIEKGTVGK